MTRVQYSVFLIGCKLCDTFLVDEPRCQSHNWLGFLYNDTIYFEKLRNPKSVAIAAAGCPSNGVVAGELKTCALVHGYVTFKDVHQGLSKQMMEGTYSYDQGYIPWNPPPYQHHAPQYNVHQSNGFGDAYYGTSITSQPLNSGDLPSQAPSIPRRSIPTLFLCANQEGKEDAPLNEEDVENLNHEEMRKCLEEVEEKNEDQEAEDVDHEVENKDKEQKGMEIVHSASSKATPSKKPSELQFEW
ncbi:hypothetical protein PIB30_084120, partial [Stylosanthes scabra]|nr:hypothetical protein [Stylosanthes scabra]